MPNNLTRPKAPQANAAVLRWEGEGDFQPDYKHPFTTVPRPYAEPNYEAQVAPPVQQTGLNAPPPQPKVDDQDDFADDERSVYEQILQDNSPEDIELFFERLQRYRKLRDSGLLAGQQQT
jgi:hypothetical protein